MLSMSYILRRMFAAGLLVGLGACEQGIPKEALQITPETLEQRQLQTRRFDTSDEADLLSASAALLQDLGFNLDESETDLGVLVASKDRDATEAGQVAGAIIIGILTGAVVPIDETQKMRASVVTRPVTSESGSVSHTNVRVTFQRIVWNTQGKISKVERLDNEEIYLEFFSKLSKSVFLEAHSI